MKTKNLIMKFGQFQEEITKASLLVSADLSNDFASIILETDQRKIYPSRLILEEQQKYLQSFIHNATYHSMNPDADVTYQTVNLFSSDKCFIYCTLFLMSQIYSIKLAQHFLYNSGKGKYTRYIWSNDMFIP